MPMAKHWADKVSFISKDYAIQLIPWKTFHLLQRFILYLTFFDAHFKGVINRPIALFSYAFMMTIWVWALVLAFYIVDAWMDQRLGESHTDTTNDQLVLGLTPIILDYPVKSELVRGDVSKRFEELVEPSKSHRLLMEKEKEEEFDREKQELLRRRWLGTEKTDNFIIADKSETDESAIPDELEMDESAIPGEPEIDESAIPGESEIDESAILGEPEIDESAIPDEPETDESAIPCEPEIDESAIPGEPEIDESAIPDEPETDESAIPCEPEIDDFTIQDEPEIED